jgi:hypothetical protein
MPIFLQKEDGLTVRMREKSENTNWLYWYYILEPTSVSNRYKQKLDQQGRPIIRKTSENYREAGTGWTQNNDITEELQVVQGGRRKTKRRKTKRRRTKRTKRTKRRR